MSYLLDTNVISALAPSQRDRGDALIEWIEKKSNDLYLSVVTATEVRAGIGKASREGATRKADALAFWWDAIEQLYSERILIFDLGAATIAGTIQDGARGQGMSPGFADIVIAATAISHRLTILTRNRRHFECFGCEVVDPFVALPL